MRVRFPRRSCGWLGLLLVLAPALTLQAKPLTILLMPNEGEEQPGAALRADDLRDRLAEYARTGLLILDIHGQTEWSEPDLRWGNVVLQQAEMLELLRRFQSENHRVEALQVRFVPWIKAQLDLAVTDADMIQIPSTWLGMMKPSLTPHGLSSEALAAEQVIWADYQDEKALVVPWLVEPQLIYYRKDLFTADDLLNWNTAGEAMRRVLAGRPLGLETPWAIPRTDWAIAANLRYFFGAAGGGFVIPDENGVLKSGLMHDRTRQAIEKLLEWRRQGLVSFVDRTQPDAVQAFLDGRYGLLLGGPPVLRIAQRQGVAGRIGLALTPIGDSGHRFSLIGGSALAIADASRKRGNYEEAKKLLEFLSRSEMVAGYAESSFYLPANPQARRAFLEHRPECHVFEQALTEASGSAPVIPATTWAEIEAAALNAQSHLHVVIELIADGAAVSQIELHLEAADRQIELAWKPIGEPTWWDRNQWWLIGAGLAAFAILLFLAVWLWLRLRSLRQHLQQQARPLSAPIDKLIESVETESSKAGIDAETTESLRSILEQLKRVPVELGKLATLKDLEHIVTCKIDLLLKKLDALGPKVGPELKADAASVKKEAEGVSKDISIRVDRGDDGWATDGKGTPDSGAQALHGLVATAAWPGFDESEPAVHNQEIPWVALVPYMQGWASASKPPEDIGSYEANRVPPSVSSIFSEMRRPETKSKRHKTSLTIDRRAVVSRRSTGTLRPTEFFPASNLAQAFERMQQSVRLLKRNEPAAAFENLRQAKDLFPLFWWIEPLSATTPTWLVQQGLQLEDTGAGLLLMRLLLKCNEHKEAQREYLRGFVNCDYANYTQILKAAIQQAVKHYVSSCRFCPERLRSFDKAFKDEFAKLGLSDVCEDALKDALKKRLAKKKLRDPQASEPERIILYNYLVTPDGLTSDDEHSARTTVERLVGGDDCESYRGCAAEWKDGEQNELFSRLTGAQSHEALKGVLTDVRRNVDKSKQGQQGLSHQDRGTMRRL